MPKRVQGKSESSTGSLAGVWAGGLTLPLRTLAGATEPPKSRVWYPAGTPASKKGPARGNVHIKGVLVLCWFFPLGMYPGVTPATGVTLGQPWGNPGVTLG